MNTMALIQTCQIEAIMTVPLRLSFSARLTNCNVGPCLHVELCTLSLLHLSYNIHSSKGFSCSMKFTTEKHWCPVSTFSYFHGKAFLGKPATITFGEKKLCVMDQIQTVVWQFFCASLGRSLCHGNKHHGIDPNMSNSGHHDSSTHLHLSYKIHSSKDFSCSMKFTTEKHWCPVSTLSYFHGKAFLGKPATITFGEKKLCVMDQIQTVVWQFFCASLGRSLCHGNKHHGIDPNMSNSGHHDSSTHLHLSYKIHSSKDFSCSMKFTTEKHWCPVSTFSYFHGKAFLGKPATITFGEKKECVMDQIQTVVWQFFCASLGRSLCPGNKHHGIDPNMSSSGHHDCSRKPVFPLHSCLSLQSCHVLAHQFADSRSCNMLTHGILYSTSACHSGSVCRADGVVESKVDQLRQSLVTVEMHCSTASSESNESDVPLQFWFQCSICKLQFCAKSHKLGINPWQGP